MRSIARSVLLVSSLLAAASVTAVERCFPPDFLFGSATASYQVEGGWNATGRTPSIWDDYCRAKPNVECANVADDFVHRYAQDIDLMVATGLSSFRFSVSWSRVMRWDKPSQRMVANADGIAFYHSVVDTLRLKGIVPILTLYHWDLPSALHTELSPPGWLNAGIVDHFVEYAELMYREFGAKVDMWTTFNEPTSFVIQGYGTGREAPAMPQSTTNTYTVAHNVLRSHAAAVSKFREFKTQQVVNAHARIGIVLVTDYSYPLDPQNDADVEAANRKMDFMFGWFLRPIVHGDYPSVMRSRVGDRLPTFTAEESASLKGSYDLFMLNHYHSKVVTDCTSSRSSINCSALSLGWEQDHGIDDTRRPEGARPSSTGPNGEYLCTWFSAYPQGYLDTIRWMHNYDPEAQILLTENGWCGNSTIDNPDQMWYFQQYLKQVHIAVNEMKIPIIGYTAWSFVDNYEWGSFGPRFGLYYVDYPAQTGSKEDWTPKDSDLKRIPRTAAKWYGSLAKTKCMEIDGDDYEQSSSATSSSSSSVGSAAWLFAVIAVVIGVVGVVVVRRRRAATRDEQSPLIRR